MNFKWCKVPALLFLLLFFSTNGTAQPDIKLPIGMELEYLFYHNGSKIGVMKRSLTEIASNHYLFESHVKSTHFLARFFLKEVIERSEFSLFENRGRPIQYEYQRKGSKNRHYLIDFDWQNSQARDQTQNEPWSLDIAENTVDKHLYQLNVMFDMQTNPETLQYIVADKGRIKTYHVENQGKETIKTPLGELDTIRLHRQSKKRSTTMWVAPEYDFLPVQVVHNEKGRKFKSVIKSIKGL